jgi:hypothetical protein
MTPRARDVNKLAVVALFLLLGLVAAHPDDDGGGKLSRFFRISQPEYVKRNANVKQRRRTSGKVRAWAEAKKQKRLQSYALLHV